MIRVWSWFVRNDPPGSRATRRVSPSAVRSGAARSFWIARRYAPASPKSNVRSRLSGTYAPAIVAGSQTSPMSIASGRAAWPRP